MLHELRSIPRDVGRLVDGVLASMDTLSNNDEDTKQDHLHQVYDRVLILAGVDLVAYKKAQHAQTRQSFEALSGDNARDYCAQTAQTPIQEARADAFRAVRRYVEGRSNLF